MSKVGWNSAFGIADETTYGTYVAPTRWYEFNSFSIDRNVERIESNAIRYGVLNRARTGAYSSVDWGASGSVEMEIPTKGFGLWLEYMFGAVATATVTTGVYTHTGSVASLTGDIFSAQALIDGDVRGFSGGKVTGWSLSCAVGDIATISLDLDFKAETEPSAGTPSYVTPQGPFTFREADLAVGGSALDVKSISLAGNNGLSVDERRFLGAVRKEPLDQGREYTGSFTAEYDGKASGTPYHRFINGTEGALTLTFTGPLISGAHFRTLTITAPVMRIDGGSPNVDGPELVDLESPFKILSDGMTWTYKSDEAAP